VNKVYCHIFLLFLLQFFNSIFVFSQTDITTNDQGHYVLTPLLHHRNFSPKYMGPNALAVPEALTSEVTNKLEIESRGTFHTTSEEKSRDLFIRLNYPIVPRVVSFEITNTIIEHYNITRAQQLQRKIIQLKENNFYPDTNGYAVGDISVSTMIQLVKNKSFPDVVLRANLRTASGNDRVNARYTDAPGYFFDATFSKTVNLSSKYIQQLAIHISGGFYCWQTYDDFHPQNDAPLASIGGYAHFGKIKISSNVGGYYGYLNNGDRPFITRTNIQYTADWLAVNIGFQKGLHDFEYTSVRCGIIVFINPIHLPIKSNEPNYTENMKH
jgi:hypothetical protein